MPKTVCALGIKISKAGLDENFRQALVPIWILLKLTIDCSVLFYSSQNRSKVSGAPQ